MNLIKSLKSWFCSPNQHYHPFDSSQPVIPVPVTLIHHARTVSTQLLLDTGASLTIITPTIAELLNVKPTSTTKFTTANGLVTTKLASLDTVQAYKHTVNNVPIAITQLPDNADIDGLLGLSFLKHFHLEIDFPNSKISLT